MPAYANLANFIQLVKTVNWKYLKLKSSLSPLVGVLGRANGTTAEVVAAIKNLRNAADPVYGSKALKYKSALHYLQRTYPVPQAQWVKLGASTRSRAARYSQVGVPPAFNPYGPGMYNANNMVRLQPQVQWEGGSARSVEDFVYKSGTPVGAVLIHLDAIQPGMHTMIEGMSVVDHMKSVLKAVQFSGGGACALHIGATPPVCAELAPEFNSFGAPVAVNETGHRHMGAAHAAFNNFVGQYATVVVMGFDSDICVRANLFGATEYPANPVVGTPSLPPLTSQADVITSRALLVTVGTVNGAEYGVVSGL